MPFMKDGKRDYAKEKKWEKEEKPSRAKDRAQRMRARRKLEKEGVVEKGDGKHVDHKKTIKSGGSNARSNLKVTSAKANLKKEAKRKASK
ncbi:HNH endonuclease signature motif containing protein [uncultured Paraglaciecola sp.]|uniref:HNH endonuclease signature motif containing protein n=1 Tax=uncultured Paraglaciecola sp. TaxID=1765024 RepID=UPI00262E2BD4|nr:HNH endonuclease signature motif containing protein [uncultured Paraglaciecola sp.]